MKLLIKTASALCRCTFLLALSFVIAGACVMGLAPDNPDDWIKEDFALQAQINVALIVAMLSAAFILLIERTGSKQP